MATTILRLNHKRINWKYVSSEAISHVKQNICWIKLCVCSQMRICLMFNISINYFALFSLHITEAQQNSKISRIWYWCMHPNDIRTLLPFTNVEISWQLWTIMVTLTERWSQIKMALSGKFSTNKKWIKYILLLF